MQSCVCFLRLGKSCVFSLCKTQYGLSSKSQYGTVGRFVRGKCTISTSVSVSRSHNALSVATIAKKKPFTTRSELEDLATKQRPFKHVSPSKALLEYLKIDSFADRALYYQSRKAYLRAAALPTIVIHYLHTASNHIDGTSNVARLSHGQIQETRAITNALESGGWTSEDVTSWAWVLSAESADDKVDRFLTLPARTPGFLLLQILRGDILRVATLRKVLTHIGNKSAEQRLMTRDNRPTLDAPADYEYIHDAEYSSGLDTSFTLQISLALKHVRRLWPAAGFSVSLMIARYVRSIAEQNGSPVTLDGPTRARLSRIINYSFHLFALPASIGPFRSMRHNWRSLKTLLEVAGSFEPPLLLDQDAYRAVVRVLAASKKSTREDKIARLRTRSWPPWRVHQDGVDAQASMEEDSSRSLLAAVRAKESGYRQHAQDHALEILGGRESDGTPTIHTRSLLKHPPKSHMCLNRQTVELLSPISDHSLASTWVARIEATRDVQEAWRAFKGYNRLGQPNLAIYFAMLRKLNYDALAERRFRYVTPGDGREAFPAENDGMSDDYRVQVRPPTFDQLYKDLLKCGLRPQGRLLSFLVRHARTVDLGIKYLQDGGIDEDTMQILSGERSETHPAELKGISCDVFLAYVHLLCRFIPRRVQMPSEVDETFQRSTPAVRRVVPSTPHERGSWRMLESRPRKRKHIKPKTILQHIVRLLSQRVSHFRPPWYALFRSLAKPGILESHLELAQDKGDYYAWQVLVGAFRDFSKNGLELDPEGFGYVCQCFEKFARSCKASDKYAKAISYGANLIRSQFLLLSDSHESGHSIPRLSHSLDGAQLHIYVRALGTINDVEGVFSVLKWMVEHKQDLADTAEETRNGYDLIKKTLIAIRVFLSDTDRENIAREMIENVELWEGWPSDESLVNYLAQDPRINRLDTEEDTEQSSASDDTGYPQSDEAWESDEVVDLEDPDEFMLSEISTGTHMYN